jgi:hypothetical protein
MTPSDPAAGTGASAAQTWATLTDDALSDEIRSNRRSERRLLLTVASVATACTAVVLVLHEVIR